MTLTQKTILSILSITRDLRIKTHVERVGFLYFFARFLSPRQNGRQDGTEAVLRAIYLRTVCKTMVLKRCMLNLIHVHAVKSATIKKMHTTIIAIIYLTQQNIKHPHHHWNYS